MDDASDAVVGPVLDATAAVGFAEPIVAWLDAGAGGPLDVAPTVASLVPPGGGWVTFVSEAERRLLR